MILVTVGGQLGFDRLIRVIDTWAGSSGREDVFCQIHDGSYIPQHATWERSLPFTEFREKLLSAEVVVAHAGMGTILMALEHGKPVLVMPREAGRKETRNDHQLATARRFREMGGVHVAMDEVELLAALGRVDELAAAPRIGGRASDELLETIREFVSF